MPGLVTSETAEIWSSDTHMDVDQAWSETLLAVTPLMAELRLL